MNNNFLKIFSILFLSLFFSSFAFACLEWQDYYVHDDGYTSDCRGFTHYTISEALAEDSVCARIYVCEGSYNEDIVIPNTQGVIIEGIGEVNITGDKGIYAYGGNVTLKNLNINNVKYTGVFGYNLNNFIISNVNITDISETIAAIGLANVEDVELDNIVIDNVSGNEIVGIYAENCNIDASNIEVKNVSGSKETIAIKLLDSEFNSNNTLLYLISNIPKTYSAKALLSQNSQLVLNDFEIGRVYGSSAYGVRLENSTLESNLMDIGYVYADKTKAFALNMVENSTVNIDVYNTMNTKASNDLSYDLFLDKSKITIKEYVAKDIALKSNLIFLIDSEIDILKSSFLKVKSDLSLLTSNTSVINLSNLSLDAKANNCFDLKNNSELNFANSDIKGKCEAIGINANNSNAELFDVVFDVLKTNVINSGFIDAGFIVSFPFRDSENKSVKANALYLESKSDYSFQDYYEKFDTINVTFILRYMYKNIEDGIVKNNIFDNYLSVLYKNGYVPKIYEFDLENDIDQEYILQIGNKMPEEIKELKIISNTTDSYKSFFAEKKTCSKVIEKTYSCYDIDLPYGFLFESNKDYELYFSLPNTWLEENNLSNEDISLYYYKDGNYFALNTEYKNNLFVADLVASSEYLIGFIPEAKTSNEPKIDPKAPDNKDQTPNPSPAPAVSESKDDLNLNNNDLNVNENLPIDNVNDINYVRGSICLLNCPEDMVLDVKNCVCKPITNTNYISYIILGGIALLLIIGIVLLSVFLAKLNAKKKIKAKKNDFDPNKKKKHL